MRDLPWPARIYVSLVVLLAAGVVIAAAGASIDVGTLAITIVLFMFVESVSTIRMAKGILVSASFPVALAAAILLGPWGAALVGLTGAFNYQPGGLALVKRVFNGAELALSLFCCGLAYELLGGPHTLAITDFPEVLVSVVGAAATYSLVNALLVSGVLVTAEDLTPRVAWRRTAAPIISYLGYGMFGLLMVVLWSTDVSALAAVLVLLPLMVARWTFTQYIEERAAYDRTVRTLVQAVEMKDYYTRGHSERVSNGAVMIAKRLGMRDDRTESLRFAGILHDIGKLGVPTRLLQKSGALSPEEFAAIQLHPVRGVEMVRDIHFLAEAYEGILHHHERVDGTGYPLGLSGTDIPEFARIIAVADAFDSMTSTRSYRGGRSIPEALDELVRCKGTHFDPPMVEAFVRQVADEGWEPAEPLAAPLEPGAEITRYDHDDPTFVLPVAREKDQ
jgi:hypothetical protein